MTHMTPMAFINIFLAGLTIIFMLVLALRSRRHRKEQEEINRRFFEAENAANQVRKKAIDPELYFVADLSHLPEIPEGDPHRVERTSKRQMIRFRQPITNLELKQMYGLSQMETLAQHEENFNEYLKALSNWAKHLSENDQKADALFVLDYAISLGAEFRNTYKLAADLYFQRQDIDNLDYLVDKVNRNHFHDPTVRQHVLDYVKGKIDELEATEGIANL